MKIGILTQPLGHNYGGILQNWALHQILSGLGHHPITIKYIGKSYGQKILTGIRDIAAYIVKHIIAHPTRHKNKLPWDYSPYTLLRRFVKNNIAQTPYLSNVNECKIRKLGLDRIIIGSDQIWRPIYNKKHLGLMFADFLSDDSPKTFAYGASFGTEAWEYSEEQTLMAQRAIKKFQSISVREKSGIDLCRKYFGREAVHVLDPTLLLNEHDYKELIKPSVFSSLPSLYAAVYILDITNAKRQIIDTICKEIGLKPFYFGNVKSDGRNLVPVEYWLATMMKSSFVITDSFHGAAFAINFRKSFITIVNHERGASRFDSLLGMFGLTNRAIDLSCDYDLDNIISERIDWNIIDSLHKKYKRKSLEYLTRNLQ